LHGDDVGGFEIDVELLSSADVEGCLGEEVEEFGEVLRRRLCEELVGSDEECITGEDGGGGIPLDMDGGLIASERGVIDEVVVDEGEVMEEFEGEGGL
jgi:hypothetical protein